MKIKVTFEYATLPPQTHVMSDIKGKSAGTLARRAIEAAQKALKPSGWTSAVVLLDRES